MSNKTQDIIYNVTSTTQAIVWDCLEGRPSAVASLKLYEMGQGDDGATEAALGTPAVETNPNTTFDAASGDGQADPRICNVTATTGITVGRRFLATNAAGETDWVEVGAVTSGASFQAKEPLRNAYAASDTLESTRITCDMLDAWIQDSSNISDGLNPNPGYRARIEYTAGGIVRVHHFGVDLVRYPGGHSVTSADMEAFRPQWSYQLPTYHREDGGARILDEAYGEFRWDLFRAGVPDETIRNQAAVDQGTRLRAWKNLVSLTDDEQALEMANREYQQFLDGLFRITAKVVKSTDTSGAGVVGTVESLWSK